MVVIDDSGMVLSFSKAAEKLFGMSSEQICGRNVSNLMPNPYRDSHDGYIDHYLKTGEKRIIGYGRVVTGKRADGSHFPMELHVGEATANGERDLHRVRARPHQQGQNRGRPSPISKRWRRSAN